MKTNINLDWTANLYEFGMRSQVADLEAAKMEAARKLAAAREAYRQTMRGIAEDAGRIEREIARLWTAEEIAAAKRGVMLVNGMECAV